MLGASVVRYSSIFSGGLIIGHMMAFASTIVLAHLLAPADFGQLNLLLFLSGLLNLLFNLGSKQGTMRRVFGADDDEDDDDEDEDEDLSEAAQRSLGTGLVLTVMLALLGTSLVVAFAPQVADLLLGGNANRQLVLWAAAAGGLGAIYRLSSLAVWMERRPVAYVILESSQPVLIVAFVVPLVATGGGIEGAIAGTAIGTGISAVATVLVLRSSFELCFEPREALLILRLGAPRILVHGSFWTISSAQIFFLSRYVGHSNLGIFSLAQRAGIVVSLLPTGFRRALRPLKRTMAFAAVEDQYGSAVARGQQLGYFLLVTIGSLLAITLFSDPLVSVAPPSYANAAPLIPLLSAAMVAPTAFRMLNKSANYRRKRQRFIKCAVAALIFFVIGCVTLIPWLGLAGAPLSMILAFALPAVWVFYLSQWGREPIAIPYRSLATAIVLGIGCSVAYYELDPAGVPLELVVGTVLFIVWIALCLVTGVVPSYHRRPLIHMAMHAIGRGTAKFEPEFALSELSAEDRELLRIAVVERRPLAEIGAGAGNGGAEQVARALRRAAEAGGAFASGDHDNDAEIAKYLFSTQTVASRDLNAKHLIQDHGVSPGDLRELEAVVDDLQDLPEDAWLVSDATPAAAR